MPTIEQIPQLPVSAERRWIQYLVDSILAVVAPLVVTAIRRSQRTGKRNKDCGEMPCVLPMFEHMSYFTA
jgi:hypothetical protein